jgi:membrane-associated HD superfamily phosphohydrolase
MNSKKILNGAALLLGLLGVYFKVQWWAGAIGLTLAGFGLLLISVLGFTARANAEAGTSDVLNYVMVATLTVGVLAVAFRFMHWPGDELLVWAANGLLLVLALLLIASERTVVSHQFVTVLAIFFILVIALLNTRPGHSLGSHPETVAVEEPMPEIDGLE